MRLGFKDFDTIGDSYPGLLVLGPDMQVDYEFAGIVERHRLYG